MSEYREAIERAREELSRYEEGTLSELAERIFRADAILERALDRHDDDDEPLYGNPVARFQGWFLGR